MRHEIHKFTGSTDCKEAIEAAELSDAIACALSPGGAVNFFDRSGRLIAKVTSRHKVARLLADQTTSLLHCSVNCVSKPDERRPNGSVNLRLILGSVGEEYTPTTQVHANYPVHVVGVSNYQDAIKSCGEGEPVALLHEIDNPFDDLAVVVRTQFGERIGYIPKDSWLMGGIHRDGKAVAASILSLRKWSGPTGVILRAELIKGPIARVTRAGQNVTASEPSAHMPKDRARSVSAKYPSASFALGQGIGRFLRLFRR